MEKYRIKRFWTQGSCVWIVQKQWLFFWVDIPGTISLASADEAETKLKEMVANPDCIVKHFQWENHD